MRSLFTLGLLLILTSAQSVFGQSATDESLEIKLIEETLMKYIEGTSLGNKEKLNQAFHPDFNLYYVTEEDSLGVWSGAGYIAKVKEGEKNSRQGRIISIDYENNAASAKVEILIPGWRVYTDYFLLLKYEGSWKIVHKSFTWKAIEEK